MAASSSGSKLPTVIAVRNMFTPRQGITGAANYRRCRAGTPAKLGRCQPEKPRDRGSLEVVLNCRPGRAWSSWMRTEIPLAVLLAFVLAAPGWTQSPAPADPSVLEAALPGLACQALSS